MESSTDDPNALVLSRSGSKKGKVKGQSDVKGQPKLDARGRVKKDLKQQQQKVISKKKRKLMERKKEAKVKKAKLADVMKSLSAHALSATESAQFASVAKIGSKRPHPSSSDTKHGLGSSTATGQKRSALAGAPRSSDAGEKKNFLPSESSSDEEESEDEGENPGPPTLNGNSNATLSDPMKESNSAPVNGDQSINQSTVQPSGKPTSAKPNKKKTAQDYAKASLSAMGYKLKHVDVSRTPEIVDSRSKLPIIGEEQGIIESILENDVTVISAETGSGKTTQVPQFLYEAGFTKRPDGSTCLIGVTEPRRIAAMSMSARVGKELSLSHDVISYQIRYEGNVTERSEVKFMTDGVLLREVQSDFLLTKYSVVIIDEAHERSMFSDILIGLLSRIVNLRRQRGAPLKLVIMSATLRVEDFLNERLFKVKPSVFHVESRQYPVTVYFNKTTPSSFLDEAYRKVVKIHRTLPAGGILVFVPGQSEIKTLMRWLKSTFRSELPRNSTEQPSKSLPKKSRARKGRQVSLSDYSLASLTKYATDQLSIDQADAHVGSSDEGEEIDSSSDNEDASNNKEQPLYCLPLYSLLSTEEQRKVFLPPPEGSRLCVIATNVAETSLTIPGITYVVDTGKVKHRKYDVITGVSQFVVEWVSQASANQRAGRAGRTGPGHCYRLFSSAVFGDFHRFAQPEITERPIDELVLQMKSMGIANCVNFPFPSPPDPDGIAASEERLTKLGALEECLSGSKMTKKITSLGRTLATLPLLPQYGKMLAMSHQHDLLPYAIALISGLSVRQLLIDLAAVDPEAKQRLLIVRKRWLGGGERKLMGDFAVLMCAICSAEYACSSTEIVVDPADFCSEHGIRYKAFVEARRLRKQLTGIVNSTLLGENDDRTGLVLDQKLDPPTDVQCKLLRQIVLASMAHNVAKLHEQSEGGEFLKGAYQTALGMKDPVFIHPSSVLCKRRPGWLIYQHILEAENGKKYMHNVTTVEPSWLPSFAAPYCVLNTPETDPGTGTGSEPYCDVIADCIMCRADGTFGPHSWTFPLSPVKHPLSVMYYRWFARFFLEGHICGQLAKFRPKLLAHPETAVKAWAHLHKKTDALVAALASRNVVSKKQLENIFEEESTFLLDQYLAWLPEKIHDDVRLIWPPKGE